MWANVSRSNRESPIGVFDSGLGGLTVLRALKASLPGEDFLYFGDQARLPYGQKSAQTIIRYSLEIGLFLAARGIKLLVIACNTASAHALGALRQRLPIPVVGVVEPACKALASQLYVSKCAVLGTSATIASHLYPDILSSCVPQVEVISVACPLFVPLVEEGAERSDAARLIAQDYLGGLKEKGVDAALLGCTHFPLLQELISQTLGPEVLLVDSATPCASAVKALLHEQDLHHPREEGGQTRYFTSDCPRLFEEKAVLYLGEHIGSVTCENPAYATTTRRKKAPRPSKATPRPTGAPVLPAAALPIE